MNPLFVDTFYFIALLEQSDLNHARVVEYAREVKYRQFVTTRWVLAETANAFSRVKTRGVAAAFLSAFATSPNVKVIENSDRLFENGFELYTLRIDKDWSLTDCISFVVMKENSLCDALTGDHHFKQAGFNPIFAAI